MGGEVPGILWYGLAVFFVLFAVVIPAWFFSLLNYRNRMKALQVLKLYAERGEEPPAAVVAALMLQSSPPESQPATRQTMLERFVQVAFLAGAAGGVAWWRIADGGGPQWIVYAAVIASAALGATAVARLAAALVTPPAPK